jgi:hypothetical protein
LQAGAGCTADSAPSPQSKCAYKIEIIRIGQKRRDRTDERVRPVSFIFPQNIKIIKIFFGRGGNSE